MSLKDAQQFVARFVTGEYRPEEYAAFSQWVKEATIEELTVIADRYESDHGKWVLPSGPSTEWMTRLEQKLDVSVGEQAEVAEVEAATVMGDREWRVSKMIGPRPASRTIGRRVGWMSAAAVVVALS